LQRECSSEGLEPYHFAIFVIINDLNTKLGIRQLFCINLTEELLEVFKGNLYSIPLNLDH